MPPPICPAPTTSTCSNAIAPEAIVAVVPHVDVNGARLWMDEQGSGPPVLFVHGGLGDMRLWEPQARALAPRFRCIRYGLRFWGRSESPGIEFSSVDDAVGVLDALDVDRAAVVGLSLGGGLALDVTLAHPDRVWALVHVAAGVTGLPVDPYSAEQTAAYEAAEARNDLDTMMEIDFAVWAPLGAGDEFCELWRATPDALGLPDGAKLLVREPAHERLEEVGVPTLVIVPTHDPPAQREVGATVARRVPGAQHVEIDSDHYLTLREPDRVTAAIETFLTASSPSTSAGR
jgi:3-oxoadipate enol-lactonase